MSELAQLLQHKGPLGQLEEEVARVFKGAELTDFGCSPPCPVEGPERAGDHAPSLSRWPRVCPQLSRLSRPRDAAGVAVRGQPLGHPRPVVAGGLVLQVHSLSSCAAMGSRLFM